MNLPMKSCSNILRGMINCKTGLTKSYEIVQRNNPMIPHFSHHKSAHFGCHVLSALTCAPKVITLDFLCNHLCQN